MFTLNERILLNRATKSVDVKDIFEELFISSFVDMEAFKSITYICDQEQEKSRSLMHKLIETVEADYSELSRLDLKLTNVKGIRVSLNGAPGVVYSLSSELSNREISKIIKYRKKLSTVKLLYSKRLNQIHFKITGNMESKCLDL